MRSSQAPSEAAAPIHPDARVSYNTTTPHPPDAAHDGERTPIRRPIILGNTTHPGLQQKLGEIRSTQAMKELTKQGFRHQVQLTKGVSIPSVKAWRTIRGVAINVTRPPRANSRILKRFSVKIVDTDQPRRKVSNSDRSRTRNKIHRVKRRIHNSRQLHTRQIHVQLINSSIPSRRKLLGSSRVGCTRHERHRSKTFLKVIFICPVHMMLQVDSNNESALDPSSSDTTVFLVISPLGDSRLGVLRMYARNLLHDRISSAVVLACLACSGLPMPTPQSGHTLAFGPRSPTRRPRALTQDT